MLTTKSIHLMKSSEHEMNVLRKMLQCKSSFYHLHALLLKDKASTITLKNKKINQVLNCISTK
jgi:hypothetical protein